MRFNQNRTIGAHVAQLEAQFHYRLMNALTISDYEAVDADTPTPASIASFPTEILAIIMSNAIRTPDFPNTNQLLQLCHVCRYWRNVCMSTPSLWSSVDASNPNMGQVFLQHCRDTPIDLYATREHRFSPFWPADLDAKAQLTELLSSYWPQVRSLMFDASDALLEVLQENATQMHRLESIRLHTTTYFRILNWKPTLGDDHSNVHTLDLEGVYIPLETNWFRDMVHLTVKLPRIAPNPPTMEAFVDILASSPRLKVLHLEWAGPTLPQGITTISSPPRLVTLPHLQKFHLSNTPRDMSYLLSKISISPPTLVSLMCETEDYASCLPILFFPQSTLYNFIPASQMVHLGVRERHARIAIYTSALDIGIQARYPFAAQDQWLKQLYPTASNLWDLYPLASAYLKEVQVHIGESCDLKEEDWMDLIGHPNLAHIEIFGVLSLGEHQFSTLMSALRKRLLGPNRPLLSSVQRMIVPDLDKSEIKRLRDYLAQRVTAGIKLEILEVAGVEGDWSDRVRDLVGEVMWKPQTEVNRSESAVVG